MAGTQTQEENKSFGFIRLYRSTIKSTVWEDETIFRIWMWCLLKASWKHRTAVMNNTVVPVPKGSFITGKNVAAKDLRMPSTTIWRKLRVLEELGQIEIESGQHFTLVSVCNFSSYQGEDGDDGLQTASDRPANGQQTGPYNKDNKDKKDKTQGDVKKENWFPRIEEAYPIHRRTGVTAALKSFKSTVKTVDDLRDCQVALSNYLASDEAQRGYIKSIKNWVPEWRDWVEMKPYDADAAAEAKRTREYEQRKEAFLKGGSQ